MDGRPIWTDCDEAGDYVVPNALSPRDLRLKNNFQFLYLHVIFRLFFSIIREDSMRNSKVRDTEKLLKDMLGHNVQQPSQ